MRDNDGKLVTVSYTGRLDDGWQFAQATPDAPMTFPCMEGMMLPEFVHAVRFMEPGETKEVRVDPRDAFQEWTEDRLVRVPAERLADPEALQPGDIVHLQDEEGTEYAARLVSLEDGEALFDANHGAVAQGLNFRITLHAVRDLPFRAHPGGQAHGESENPEPRQEDMH